PYHPSFPYTTLFRSIPAVLTVTVLVIAAVFFPARGAEADRANLFSKDLTVASGAAVESSISLGAIAGVVIAIMGAVLVLIGVVPVLTNHAINLESLIMGGVFATIGMVMIACSHLTRKQTRQG